MAAKVVSKHRYLFGITLCGTLIKDQEKVKWHSSNIRTAWMMKITFFAGRFSCKPLQVLGIYWYCKYQCSTRMWWTTNIPKCSYLTCILQQFWSITITINLCSVLQNLKYIYIYVCKTVQICHCHFIWFNYNQALYQKVKYKWLVGYLHVKPNSSPLRVWPCVCLCFPQVQNWGM